MMLPRVLILLSLLIVKPLFAETIEGRIDWSQRLSMSTTVSGIIDKVLVSEGDQVQKGDVLLRLQADRFKAALASARATNKDAKYKLAEAEREWERAQELYDRTVLSDRDLQLAENGLIEARAEFSRTSSQYINAQRDLIESVIRAPFDAIVLEQHALPGQTVITRMQSVPLVTIADRGSYHAIALISLDAAKKMTTGEAVTVRVDGSSYQGKVASIAYEPDKGTSLYRVTVRFMVDNGVLRSGQAALIDLP